MKYDSTGMFHWCEDLDFKDVQIQLKDPENAKMCGHILVCIHGSEDSAELGLRNFVIFWGWTFF